MDMNTETKAKRAIIAFVTVALLGIAAPLAFADDIGAPTSAAGGLSAPSSPDLPSAAGPMGSSASSVRAGPLNGSSMGEDSRILQLQPGTGKFEGRNNGTDEPCIGSTGFGSSDTLPGHKC